MENGEQRPPYLGSQSSPPNQQRGNKGKERKEEAEEACGETETFIGSYNLIKIKGFVCGF